MARTGRWCECRLDWLREWLSSSDFSRRSLALKFGGIVTLTTLVVLVGAAVQGRYGATQEEWAARINDSGSLRWLSQAVALAALRTAAVSPGPGRDRLREELLVLADSLEVRFERLQRWADESHGRSAHDLAGVMVLLESEPAALKERVERFVQLARSLGKLPDAKLTTEHGGLRDLLVEAPILLDHLNALVAEVQDQAMRAFGNQIARSRRVLGGSVFLLLVTGLVIVEPALRRAQAESEERYRALFAATPDAVVVVDGTGRIREANAHSCALLDLSRDAVLGSSLREFLPDFRCTVGVDGVDCGCPDPVEGEQVNLTALRRDGTGIPVEVRWSHLGAARSGLMTLSIRDVTDRRRLEEALRHQALHDPLTTLPNRILLQDRLESAVERSRRFGDSVAVLYLDLDRFKVVNDSLGHGPGDELLRQVGNRLSRCFRGRDTVARVGGDEFVIVAELTGDTRAPDALMERLSRCLGAPVRLAGEDMELSASVGIAILDPWDEQAEVTDAAETLIRQADMAMFEAKKREGTSFHVFNPALDQWRSERWDREADLRRAVREREIVVHYQPVVCLATGRIIGAEALARWNHPTRGLVPPNDFIPVAEDSGLILPIGRLVLETVCRDLRRWDRALRRADPLVLFVNLSPRQLDDPGMPEEFAGILTEAGVDPCRLEFEVTESAIIHRADALEDIRELGARIAVDDFATGYSSIRFLRELRVDTIKIDRSFTVSLGGSGAERDGTIVEALIQLGRGLGITVVAEGVERAVQLDALRELRCNRAQGHYFSEPVAGDAFVRLAAEDPSW